MQVHVGVHHRREDEREIPLERPEREPAIFQKEGRFQRLPQRGDSMSG